MKLGKGQFLCGNKKCSESEMMRTWEVNFAYLEDGEKKNALVSRGYCINKLIRTGGFHTNYDIFRFSPLYHKFITYSNDLNTELQNPDHLATGNIYLSGF